MRDQYDVRRVYLGNGLQSVYTYDFKCVSYEHLRVLLVNTTTGAIIWSVKATDSTYFTTAFNTNFMGGTLTFVSPIPSGRKLIILLADDLPKQPSKYTADPKYTMRQIENSLDYLSGQIQRLKYQADRSLRLPEKITNTFAAELSDIFPEHVILINETSDGFQLVPRTEFKGDPGTPGLSTSFYFQDDEPTVAEVGDMWITTAGLVYKFAAGVWTLQGSLGGTPPGTEAYSVLETAETNPGEFTAQWSDPIVYKGFTERWNEIVDLSGAKATMDYIMKMGYAPPNVSLGSNVSNANREPGNAITSMTLTASIVKVLNDIAQVRFYQNPSTLLDTQNSGGGIPAGGNSTYAWSGSFNSTTTFRVEVDDNSARPKPSRTATLTYNFMYPYFSGKGAAAVTPATIYSTHTKTIANVGSSTSVSFSFAIGEKPYFSYPASFSDLTSIKNVNNLETIGSWTKRTENMTNAYGQTVSYKIYEFNNVAGEANNNTYTFIR